jgi:hypothetical protein
MSEIRIGLSINTGAEREHPVKNPERPAAPALALFLLGFTAASPQPDLSHCALRELRVPIR